MKPLRHFPFVALLAALALPCSSVGAEIAQCKNHYILAQPCYPAPFGLETFRIRQLYSSQDGEFQFVELENTVPTNGSARLAGARLSVTDRRGRTKTIHFDADLSVGRMGGQRVAIASEPFDELLREDYPYSGAQKADFTIPVRFLPTDGGTIVLAGADSWTYERLPTDGATSLMRSGEEVFGLATNFDGEQFTAGYYNLTVREFRHKRTGEYFLTGSEPELDQLLRPDSGWETTGGYFSSRSIVEDRFLSRVFGAPQPVCRFRTTEEHGNAQLFVLAAECELIAEEWPDFTLELTAAFHAWQPDERSGACPTARRPGSGMELKPLYRLHRYETNELRYTTKPAVRDLLEREGWIVEGWGTERTAMCVTSGNL